MNWQTKNIKVYNKSAKEFAEHFSEVGVRHQGIERAFKLLGERKNIRALELGCGAGIDAAEIIKRVNYYIGVDPSKKLLNIAKQNVPNAIFELSNAVNYGYPDNVDIIFAFASLLHVNQDDLCKVFEKAAISLNKGGIFYIVLKRLDHYEEKVKKDRFGERMFYFYNSEIIKHIAGRNFTSVYTGKFKVGDVDWFGIALRRK